ncbi:DNA repair protein XRCC1 [Chelonia mydas]|uniref:DNA repair protein XRCC1 n=1 Tax=Chelonia mydas TaxID=8469 RepID=M7CK69_CHEMY|nr:DNA repair protein XRCC1 [Chelonia mydas]
MPAASGSHPRGNIKNSPTSSQQGPLAPPEAPPWVDSLREVHGVEGDAEYSEFEKEERIHSIDVGNEGSAFVEVLAGSSASPSEQDYEVLLVTSSFMSPSESKAGTNLNRVRMFGPDKLVKAAAEKKWDRVKIVCTQPYTKTLAYGLSFVKFHSPPENNETQSKSASPKVTKLGQFKVKDEDSSSASMRPGADPAPTKRKFEFSKENSAPPSARKPDPEAPHSMQPAPKKPKASPQEAQRLLQGTVFVLSGFQTPFRSELRDKALEMGAKYRPDRTPDSTHLICAFANTPKYSQRAGLPSSNHQGKAPARALPPQGESSGEETEPGTSWANAGNSRARGESSPASTDSGEPAGARDSGEGDSGDTDDELRRVEEEHRKKQQAGREAAPDPDDDPYGGSTDENTDVEEEPDQPIPELPDFFVGKRFFLYGEFPSQERRLLNRYITAFSGEVEGYMNERVNYVITAQEWDDTFEEALNDNANLSFVRPRWIYTCTERQRLIPHQPYVVVPQA